MKKSILIISPHPDDESLGCGGTIKVYKKLGYQVHWLICTRYISKKNQEIMKEKEQEIKKVFNLLEFDSLTRLDLSPGKISNSDLPEIINKFSSIVKKKKITSLFIPSPSDIHSDHRIIFEAASSLIKWYRHPLITESLIYETLSETNFSLPYSTFNFKPNYYVDISDFLDFKINLVSIYKTEFGNHPFPRSKESVKALSILRGSEVGVKAAEGFMLLKFLYK